MPGCSHGAERNLWSRQVHQLAFISGKAGEALFYKFGCGKDGVVVRYLFCCSVPGPTSAVGAVLGQGQQPSPIRHKMLCRLAHVTQVEYWRRAGIGQQFLFIKLSGIVRSAFAVVDRRFALLCKGGQVIEFGRLFNTFSPNGRADCICTCAFSLKNLRFLHPQCVSSLSGCRTGCRPYNTFLSRAQDFFFASRSTSIFSVGVCTGHGRVLWYSTENSRVALMPAANPLTFARQRAVV